MLRNGCFDFNVRFVQLGLVQFNDAFIAVLAACLLQVLLPSCLVAESIGGLGCIVHLDFREV
jgi:hypothetical protein